MTDPNPVAVDVRHRRGESWRCEPMADGRRDPLDPTDAFEPSPRACRNQKARRRGATSGRPAVLTSFQGRFTGRLEGADGGVIDGIRTLGLPFQRAPEGGAWLVPRARINDLLALLETRGYPVVLIEAADQVREHPDRGRGDAR